LDTDSRRELNRGLGDGLARAFELAVTPLLFALAGFGLDAWLGTTPAFLLVLFFVAVLGIGVREWYAYDAKMKEHEAELARRRGGA
jgi:Flp pilus assembly protein TadB